MQEEQLLLSGEGYTPFQALSVFLPNVLYAIPVFGRCTFVEPFKLFREV